MGHYRDQIESNIANEVSESGEYLRVVLREYGYGLISHSESRAIVACMPVPPGGGVTFEIRGEAPWLFERMARNLLVKKVLED
jgi:hypothetical protein